MAFELDKQLEKETVKIISLPLCDVLLSKEDIGPWLILVPRVENKTEIFQLTLEDQRQLLQESSLISEMLKIEFNADKMNVAAIGNVVPQLHVHHVARFYNDAIWPKPIWGNTSGQQMSENKLNRVIEQISTYLNASSSITGL
ncbi:HIT domain-containing protein [uncultured Shewanella sp.]|uniref:HIT domain-containing protein n=1 Tax=uncultured Shewanella sp. TaxID=173975 RepID=UPI00260A0E81|nr:HIT domain-containing protein [uncultured Shewanella sp.]